VSSQAEPAGAPVDGEVALEARDDDGGYLTLWFGCPPRTFGADEAWLLRADASGRAVSAVASDPGWRCSVASRNACLEAAVNELEGRLRELHIARCHACTAGDGRLDVHARFDGKAPFGAGGVCAVAGNTRREDGDRSALREMLSTLLVLGRTGPPAPGSPPRRAPR
jgi:hypothetical protein